eukprot:4683018-Pleurochrysis_carterae.AAC.3
MKPAVPDLSILILKLPAERFRLQVSRRAIGKAGAVYSGDGPVVVLCDGTSILYAVRGVAASAERALSVTKLYWCSHMHVPYL